MKNVEVPRPQDAEPIYVTNETVKALKLFYDLEQTMICIAYTNAVNHCIGISIKNPYDSEGYFSIDGFYNGKYDTEELLEKLFIESQLFFEKYKERFSNTSIDIIEYIKEEYSKYDFSKQFKYLTYFVEYLNRKKMVRSKEN